MNYGFVNSKTNRVGNSPNQLNRRDSMKRRDKAGKKDKNKQKDQKPNIRKAEAKSKTLVKKAVRKKKVAAKKRTTTGKASSAKKKPATTNRGRQESAKPENKGQEAFSPSETRKDFTSLRRLGAAIEKAGDKDALRELNAFIGMFHNAADLPSVRELTSQWNSVKKALPSALKGNFDFQQSAILAGVKFAQKGVKVLASIQVSMSKGVDAHNKVFAAKKPAKKRRGRKPS